MQLSTMNKRNIALWAVQKQLVGLNAGLGDITTAVGNLDIYNGNIRQIQRIDGTATSSSGTAANAYDQNLATVCTEVGIGNIDITFTTAGTQLTTIGIMPAASGAWTFGLWTNDGTGWALYQSVSTTVTAGKWLWYDFDGIDATNAFRIASTGTTSLVVAEIVCGNTPQEVPLAAVDRDTFTQLSNRTFLGRPTQYYWDRQIPAPILRIWPIPSTSFEQTYLLSLWIQRQLQDVGTMAQQIEIPDRWYLAIIADLARNLAAEIKEVDRSIVPALEDKAESLLAAAWNGESDGSNARLLPNLRAYTA